jgi:hypothetical protein
LKAVLEQIKRCAHELIFHIQLKFAKFTKKHTSYLSSPIPIKIANGSRAVCTRLNSYTTTNYRVMTQSFRCQKRARPMHGLYIVIYNAAEINCSIFTPNGEIRTDTSVVTQHITIEYSRNLQILNTVLRPRIITVIDCHPKLIDLKLSAM